MINFDDFDDTPIAGQEEAAAEWSPPQPQILPDPGTYQMVLANLNPLSFVQHDDSTGKILTMTCSHRIVGGEFDGWEINFVRISSKLYDRFDGKRTSGFIDLFCSAKISPIPRTIREIVEACVQMEEQMTPFTVRLSWTATCADCYKERLCELTGTSSFDDAKRIATAEQRREANNYAAKATKNRDFPVDTTTGKRIPVVQCKRHGEIIAQAKVRYI